MVLLRGGVPFEIAFPSLGHLTDAWRYALAIILQELEGGKFDFDNMKWVEQK